MSFIQVDEPPPPNVPYSLALFLASPKEKGEKEGRRSARGPGGEVPPRATAYNSIQLFSVDDETTASRIRSTRRPSETGMGGGAPDVAASTNAAISR